MSDIDYARDIPAAALLLDEEHREAVLTRAIYDRIGNYQTSVPTGPRAGRVYRRDRQVLENGHVQWPHDTLYIVRDCPGDDGHPLDGGQDHIPFAAYLV